MRLENIRNLISDDEAVSPVIGVILMVAITVILAAVIGTFVLGLGNKVTGSTAPTADFAFDFTNKSGINNDYLAITHNGGDGITVDRLSVSTTKAVDLAKKQGNIGGDSTSTNEAFTDTGGYSSGAKLTAGNTAYVGGNGDLSGETFRITWTSEGGGSSQTLASFTTPS